MIRTERNKKRNLKGVGIYGEKQRSKIFTWPGSVSNWPIIGHLLKGEKKSSELHKDIKKEKPLL